MTFVWQQGGKMFEMLLFTIISIVVARLLGPEKSGVYAAVGAVQGMLCAFVAFGYEESLTNFLGRYSDKPGIISFILRELLKRRLMYVSLAMGLMAALASFVTASQGIRGYEWAVQLSALMGILSSLGTFFTFTLIALFDVKVNNVMRAVTLVVQLVLVVWLIRAGYGIAGAIWSFIIAMTVYLIGIAWPVVRRMLPTPERIELKPVVRFGLGLWVNALVGLVLGKQLGLIVLGAFGVEEAWRGYFNAAFNTRVLADQLMLAGFGGTALAAAARLAERQGTEGLALAWRLNVRLTTLLAVPTMVFFMFQAPRAIQLLFGGAFLPAATVFLWLAAPTLIARAYGGGASSTVMSAGGMVSLVVKQYVIGGVASVVLSVLAVWLFRPYGAEAAVSALALAMGIAFIITSGLGFAVVRRVYEVRFPTAYTVKVFAISALAGVSTLWLVGGRSLWVLPLAVQFILVFYVLARLVRPLSAEDYSVAQKASRRISKFVRPLVGEPIPEAEEG